MFNINHQVADGCIHAHASTRNLPPPPPPYLILLFLPPLFFLLHLFLKKIYFTDTASTRHRDAAKARSCRGEIVVEKSHITCEPRSTHNFAVTYGDRPFYFRAASLAERGGWIDALLDAQRMALGEPACRRDGDSGWIVLMAQSINTLSINMNVVQCTHPSVLFLIGLFLFSSSFKFLRHRCKLTTVTESVRLGRLGSATYSRYYYCQSYLSSLFFCSFSTLFRTRCWQRLRRGRRRRSTGPRRTLGVLC